MQGPKLPFLLILVVYGPGEVIVDYWDRFCIWVELPVQRRLCSIFVRGVGSPDTHEYSAG